MERIDEPGAREDAELGDGSALKLIQTRLKIFSEYFDCFHFENCKKKNMKEDRGIWMDRTQRERERERERERKRERERERAEREREREREREKREENN